MTKRPPETQAGEFPHSYPISHPRLRLCIGDGLSSSILPHSGYLFPRDPIIVRTHNPALSRSLGDQEEGCQIGNQEIRASANLYPMCVHMHTYGGISVVDGNVNTVPELLYYFLDP